MVRSGLVMAWRLATSPTRTSPDLEKATTEGVVRPPSALGMTTGSPASKTLTTELVVPRSIPVEAGKPRFVVAVWEWKAFLGAEAKERGIRANVSSFTRLHPNIMMTKAKVSGNYVSSILAKTESQRAGFDEAIMLGPDGYVAECTGENLFVVRNNVIYTTPRAAILEGITRDSLLTLARDLGYTVNEEPISRDQLYISDEVFVCGTAAEVIALREIDFRPID